MAFLPLSNSPAKMERKEGWKGREGREGRVGGEGGVGDRREKERERERERKKEKLAFYITLWNKVRLSLVSVHFQSRYASANQ